MQGCPFSWSWLLALVLAGCSSHAPPANLIGLTGDELIAQMGQPDRQRQMPSGTRLEFPRGPMGVHTWFVYLDTSGRVIRSEQVLTEQNFNQISSGTAQGGVLQLLGRPGAVQGLGRSRGVVRSYRYENPFCQWFQVELSQEQQVRSTGLCLDRTASLRLEIPGCGCLLMSPQACAIRVCTALGSVNLSSFW